jgi:hypothetical protein
MPRLPPAQTESSASPGAEGRNDAAASGRDGCPSLVSEMAQDLSRSVQPGPLEEGILIVKHCG